MRVIWTICVAVVCVSVVSGASASGEQMFLTIESYDPATLPTVTKAVELVAPSDQLEVSRQAALLALSQDGWGWEVLGGVLEFREPPEWSSSVYFIDLPDPHQELEHTMGYGLNEEAMEYGPSYHVVFHTDEWAARKEHDFGEEPDNYGVISGSTGGIYAQCPVPHWGHFSVRPIPEPATLSLLALGGFAVLRRRNHWRRRLICRKRS